jgi:hypothetical protein
MPGIYVATQKRRGLPSQQRGDGRVLEIIYFLENYIGNDDGQCRYIRGRCSYVSRTKQGREKRALLGFSWYQGMYNATDEVSHKQRSL